ncbi:MAG: HDOD domain-containing protein [Desulfobacteraceae bacterium]|nr:MAG: HDOD domain-containing protein [Desulfobacteraceae bacterium]
MATMQRFHVAAGTYHTSDRQPLLLQAYLGTCVGIALYCRATGIGGIIHLLLPEPVSRGGACQPEKYAKTGVPVFIEALLARGARRETLTASLAGGALMGPLSDQDLALDIGGRTAEVARAILAAYAINVIQSETGGFFTCCLSLDMASGRCTIEPAGQRKGLPAAESRATDPAEITASMDRLQPIPQVALKVLRIIDAQGHTIHQIADEIRKDQVITARTLRLANSALFAKKHPIESLDHALVYLGQDQLVKLVLSAAVQSYFEQTSVGYSLCKGGLYHHAIGCAQVAEALALKTGKVDSGIAYTAGLLHDIGKVVLDQHMAPVYPLFYRRALEEDENVQSIEKRLFGIDHTEVGHSLARKWSFPPSLAHAIRFHHHPEQESEYKLLAVIVYLADVLLSRFHIGVELERLDTRKLTAHLESIGLTSIHFADLVDLIPERIFKAMPDESGGVGLKG